MLITAQLFNNGTRIGVSVNDDGVCYEVPLESLYNPIIFEDLLNSGYKFVNYEDYEFVRDGQRVSDLPCRDYTPTEDFYKVRGETMSEEQLRSRLSTNYVAAIQFKETGNYVINTREEFITYLNSITNGVTDSDFMPVNAFVAPAARFNPDELGIPSVRTYMDILENRRRYSYNRYVGLKKWLEKQEGHALNARAVIDLYYSYGIDGLNLAVSHKNEYVTTDSPYGAKFVSDTVPTGNGGQRALTIGEEHTREVMRGNYVELLGIANSNFSDVRISNNIDVTPEYREHPVFKNSTYEQGPLAATHSRLGINQYSPVLLIMPQDHIVREWTLINAGAAGFATVCDMRFTLTVTSTNEYGESVNSSYSYNSLRVMNPAAIYNEIEVYNWDKSYDFFVDCAILMGCANELIHKRTKPCNTSSYQILLEMGLSPKEACRYIAASNGYLNYPFSDSTKEDRESGAVTVQKLVRDSDLLAFFGTDDINEVALDDYTTAEGIVITGAERLELISNIISGEEDLGNISAGVASDFNTSVTALYDKLRAAAFILNIPVRSIMEQCNEFDGSREFIDFSNDNITIRVDVPASDKAYQAAMSETYQLENTRITNAHTFYKIDDVATELTNDPSKSNRQIAIHGVACAYKKYSYNSATMNAKAEVIPEIASILEEMTESYIDFYHGQHPTTPLDAVSFIAAKKARFFIIALYEGNGRLNPNYSTVVPSDWMDITVSHPTWLPVIKSNCYVFADTILSVADSILTMGNGKPEFLSYCVNATVMPDRVVPVDGAMIHEVPLKAVYSQDFATTYWDDIKPLLAVRSYFHTPEAAWVNAKHLNRIVFAVPINSYGDCVARTEGEIYSDIKASVIISDNVEQYNANLSKAAEKSRRHSVLANSSLAAYEYYGNHHVDWLHINVITPPHPLSTTYPREYPAPEFPVEHNVDRPKHFGTGRCKSFCLVNDDDYDGPSTVGGLDVDRVSNRTSLSITTNALKGLPTLCYGLRGADLCADNELIKFGNYADKGYLRVVNGNIYDMNGHVVKSADLSNISSEEYNIAHVFGRIHYFYTPDGKLFRVEV